MNQITVISKYATGDNHSALDDMRYFEFLIGSGCDFRLYTSIYSVNCILRIYPESQKYLSVIEYSEIDIKTNGKVIFTGYSELDIIFFLVKNIIRRPRLILVATNNFSNERVKRRNLSLRLFLSIVYPFLERLVLHTDHERKLISGLNQAVADKSYVKKHHLMTKSNNISEPKKGIPIISYFGPEKHDKPIIPLIELIKADVDKKFLYRIFNVKLSTLLNKYPDLIKHTNIEVVEEWQSHASYHSSVKDSTFLLLSHSRAFEGKLSGNLCDCFALQTPFIARPMEPMLSYNAMFGPLGFLIDFDEYDWASRFLDRYDNKIYSAMCQNLAQIGEIHSMEAINADLTRCFLN